MGHDRRGGPDQASAMGEASWPTITAAIMLLAHGGALAQIEPSPESSQGSEESFSSADNVSAEPYETIPVEAEPQGVPEDAATELSEIVVTSTKRTKSLRDIPASISVLDAEALSRSGAQGQQDFLRLVPGVNYENYDFGSNRITIRGISAIFNGNQTTGVLFGDVSFVDFYLPRVALDPNPFDMQDVEVLKGPQGTLFGASSLNGAIRYVPQKPQLGENALKYFGQHTTVAQGGTGLIYGAAANVAVGDDAAVRFMGFTRHTPGYIDDLQQDLEDVNSTDQDGARVIAAWRPGDAWDLSMMYAKQRTDKADASYADNYEGRLSRNNSPRQSPARSWYDIATLGVGYEFALVSVLSETALVRKRYDMFFDLSRITNSSNPQEEEPSTIGFTDVNRTDTWSQEFRFVSPDGGDSPWQWVAGLFGTRQELYDDRNFPTSPDAYPAGSTLPHSGVPNQIPGAGGSVTSDGQPNAGQATSDIVTTEVALFGELARKLGATWEATVGARYYRTRLGGTVRSSGALYQSFNQVGTTETVNRDEIREEGLSPKVSLAWHATRDVRTYAAVSRGFRVGGLQPPAFMGNPSFESPPVFKSDTIWNYELGLRTQWFDDTLRIDVTGFHVQWQDPQLLQVTQGNISSYVDNVGGARSDGVELSSIYRLPFDGLTLTLAGTYAETVTTEPFTTSAGINAPPGTPWPLAPLWQTASELRYVWPLGNWQVMPSIMHTYISSATAYLLQGEVFGYQQWDAQVGLLNPGSSWQPELSLVLNNVMDVRGVTSDQPVPQFGFNDVTYVTPRALTLRIGGRF